MRLRPPTGESRLLTERDALQREKVVLGKALELRILFRDASESGPRLRDDALQQVYSAVENDKMHHTLPHIPVSVLGCMGTAKATVPGLGASV